MQRCLGCFEEFGSEYDICPFCGYEVGTAPKEAYHMTPGTRLSNRIVIGKTLGFGGFGVTYIGYDELMERKVAIKEYLPSEFSTRIPGHTQITAYEGERFEQFTNGLKKFVNEAQMLAKMQETNGVVQIYNTFEENSTAYIVMEYLEGKNLKDFIEEHERITVDEAKEILHPIIEALKDVHAMGIIHRDIAPDNIFLTNDGRVKLLDFGASRFATTSHSKSLSVIIKQGYAPMEQYRSRADQGPWTDVYSLAATFYKLVTGITPEDSMERAEKDNLVRPSKLGVKIPKNTEIALMNALNLTPEHRTQNMEAFEEQLYSEGKVKATFKKIKKADVGKWPIWAKVSVALGAAAVLIFATLLATGVIDYTRFIPDNFALSETQARVPNIVNTEQPSAEKALKTNSLKMVIVDKQNSEYIPQDMVVAQGISKGKIVDKGTIVEVVISAGREPVVMPALIGLTAEEATTTLAQIGLTYTITSDYGAAAPGSILSQSVEAGTIAYRGDNIDLVLSKGYDTYIDTQKEVVIPDFSGMTYEKACKIAEEHKLYLIRKTTTQKGKKNTVIEQDPPSKSTGHEGDTVTIYIYAGETTLFIPDVQFKDESDAVAALEAIGLKVNIVREENAQVAKGKVISQSIEAGTEVTDNNKEITLVISEGTEEINLAMAEWSEWVEALPDGVTNKKYVIEERKQYSFRDQSMTESKEANLSGWTQYDEKKVRGDYGEWSAWSEQRPGDADNREINTKTQYSYSDYETTTQEDNSSLSGWTLDDSKTATFYKEDWGAWSDYSESMPTPSDSLKYEQKTQYQYCDKKHTTSRDSSLPGWSQTGSETKYGEWGAWSSWVNDDLGNSDVREKEARAYYEYSYFTCPKCGAHVAWFDTTERVAGKCAAYGGGCDSDYIPGNATTFRSGTAPTGTFTNTWVTSLTKAYANTPEGGKGYRAVGKGPDGNEYRYRERERYTLYSYEQWGDWSSWSDDAVSATNEKQVNTRTVYRYSTRPAHYTYTFFRWSAPTDYSDTPASESATRKVTTRSIYQYRDRADYVIYYYYQWGNWSEFRDEKVDSSDTREVETRTLYRYKIKQ